MTSTPTLTLTPTQTFTNSPTPAVTATHGPLVANFENNTANDKTLWNGGAVLVGSDTYPGTVPPAAWTASSGTAPLGTGNSSNFVARLDGTMAQQVYSCPGNPSACVWSYAFIAFELIPGGDAGGAGNPGVNLSAYYGVTFDYRAGAAGINYRIFLKSAGPNYEYDFTPSDTNWHTMTVYFPSTGAANIFTVNGGGTTSPALDLTSVGAIQVEPVQNASANENYDISVDNITMVTAPPPTPTMTPTPSMITCIMCFDGSSVLVSDYSANVLAAGAGIDTNCGSGSTVNPYNVSAMVPGNVLSGPFGTDTGSNAVRIQGNAGPDFVVLEIPFVGGGCPQCSTFTDVTAYAPNQRITFDYKATVAGGMSYIMQFVQEDFPSGNYGYYEYTWTPADTSWHTVSVYFPTGSGTPKLTLPGTGPAFNPAKAGELEFGPTWHASATPYDITIDNIRFD
jgi:hypothetical protein